MTTGYIIQVQLENVIRYVGAGGKIGQFPKFFNNSGRVKHALKLENVGHGNSKYSAKVHLGSTTVIQVKNLEAGMSASLAVKFTGEKFLEQSFSGLATKNNPKAIYMIQLASPLELASTADPIYVKGADKFGRRWNAAGHVRSHIAGRLRLLTGKYKGAKVLEIEMHPDGITPKQVKSYLIHDFYCASPTSRKSFERHFSKYYPTKPPGEFA